MIQDPVYGQLILRLPAHLVSPLTDPSSSYCADGMSWHFEDADTNGVVFLLQAERPEDGAFVSHQMPHIAVIPDDITLDDARRLADREWREFTTAVYPEPWHMSMLFTVLRHYWETSSSGLNSHEFLESSTFMSPLIANLEEAVASGRPLKTDRIDLALFSDQHDVLIDQRYNKNRWTGPTLAAIKDDHRAFSDFCRVSKENGGVIRLLFGRDDTFTVDSINHNTDLPEQQFQFSANASIVRMMASRDDITFLCKPGQFLRLLDERAAQSALVPLDIFFDITTTKLNFNIFPTVLHRTLWPEDFPW